MSLWAVPDTVVIIAVAGSMPLLALLISWLLRAHISEGPRTSSSYECGFESEALPCYVSEKRDLISIYLILELFVALILASVVLDMSNKPLIKILVLSFALSCRGIAKRALL